MLKKCVNCNNDFEARGNTKLCSEECKKSYYISLNACVPFCVICNKEMTLKSIKKGSKTCSPSCASILGKRNQSKESKENQIKNFKASMNNKTQKEKELIALKHLKSIRKTYRENKELILEKYKNTCISKYGYENPSLNPYIKAKIKNSNINKSLKEKENIENKKKKSNLLKFNSTSYSKTEDFLRDQLKRTLKKLHKTQNKSLVQEVLYEGLKSVPIDEIVERRKFITDLEYIRNNCFCNGVYNTLKAIKHFCISNKRELELRKFLKLKVKYNKSKEEYRIFEILKNRLVGVKIETSNRSLIKSPYNRFLELDIYIPSLKLAIEYNGTYYHSKNLYYNNLTKEEYKTLKCLEKGIKLFHIWDYENIEEKLEEILKCF